MAFKDVDEFFDPALKLPMRGKVYRIESPDGEVGLWCQRLMATAVKATSDDAEVTEDDVTGLKLDDDEEQNLYVRLMGDAYSQMLEDGIPWEWIKHAGVTCLIWVTRDVETAEKYWNAGGTAPKAKKQPQDRKKPAAKKSAPRGSRGGSTPQQQGKKVQPGGTS